MSYWIVFYSILYKGLVLQLGGGIAQVVPIIDDKIISKGITDVLITGNIFYEQVGITFIPSFLPSFLPLFIIIQYDLVHTKLSLLFLFLIYLYPNYNLDGRTSPR